MKVFIVGASGFIGNAVALAFLQKGDQVTGLCKTQKSAEKLTKQGITAVIGDMENTHSWFQIAKDADVLIHLAHLRPKMRLSSGWLKKSQKLRDTCLSALVDAAEQSSQCKALIYTSGMIAFGNHGDNLIDENTPSMKTALGAYHLGGEKIIQQAAKKGIPALSLRPGMVYGNEGTFRKFFLDVARKGKYQYPGDGSNFIPFIHVDDLAKAYLLAVEKMPAGKVISVVDDKPVKMREMADALLSSMGGGKASSVPRWLVGLFAGNALAEMLVGSYRIKNDQAKELLGWQPRFKSFAEGIPYVVEEYQKSI